MASDKAKVRTLMATAESILSVLQPQIDELHRTANDLVEELAVADMKERELELVCLALSRKCMEMSGLSPLRMQCRLMLNYGVETDPVRVATAMEALHVCRQIS